MRMQEREISSQKTSRFLGHDVVIALNIFEGTNIVQLVLFMAVMSCVHHFDICMHIWIYIFKLVNKFVSVFHFCLSFTFYIVLVYPFFLNLLLLYSFLFFIWLILFFCICLVCYLPVNIFSLCVLEFPFMFSSCRRFSNPSLLQEIAAIKLLGSITMVIQGKSVTSTSAWLLKSRIRLIADTPTHYVDSIPSVELR